MSALAAVPIALVAIGLVAVLGFDAAYGGSAQPPEPIGDATPVRFAYVEPTVTPTLEPGAQATPRPQPTLTGGRPGSGSERDGERRTDLLRLAGAANEVRDAEGAYPTTNNNVQTICAYQNVDVGCQFGEILGEIPLDPLGDPIQNGYWYQSDGQTATFYAALENEPGEGEACETEDVELQKRLNLICITVP